MPVYPDAELENADWTKQTWDYPGVPDTYWQEDAPIAELQLLAGNPAYRAAPERVKKIIADRLAATAD